MVENDLTIKKTEALKFGIFVLYDALLKCKCKCKASKIKSDLSSIYVFSSNETPKNLPKAILFVFRKS